MRVNCEVAAAGVVGVVSGAFNVAGAQAVGVLSVRFNFGLDLQCCFEAEWCDGVEYELADGFVYAAAGNGLADSAAMHDGVPGAAVGGVLLAFAGVIAGAHSFAAVSADCEALQQRVSFSYGAGVAVVAVCGSVIQQDFLVVLIGLPGDVGLMGVWDEGYPLVTWNCFEGGAAVSLVFDLFAAVTECAGVTGAVDDLKDSGVREGRPGQFTLVWSAPVPNREIEVLIIEILHCSASAAVGGESAEQQSDGLLYCGVRVELDVVVVVVDESDWQGDFQFTADCLGALSADESGADEVQLSLAHRAFEAQQELVVEVTGVVEPVFIADEGAGEGAEFQQAVPVSVVACQAADFQAQDNSGVTHAYFSYQLLEAFTVAS